MLGLCSPSKLDWGSFTISTAKTTSKKIGPLINLMEFLYHEVTLYPYKIYHSTMHLNTVIMSGLVLLAATWEY